jgi:uncharacterized coiled-coil protein SlyX
VLLQQGFGGSTAPIMPSVTTAAHEQISTELLETTKGPQITQQQAVDQFQIVQDQLIAQRAETKRLSEQIAILNEKLDAMQQSIAAASMHRLASPHPVPRPNRARPTDRRSCAHCPQAMPKNWPL